MVTDQSSQDENTEAFTIETKDLEERRFKLLHRYVGFRLSLACLFGTQSTTRLVRNPGSIFIPSIRTSAASGNSGVRCSGSKWKNSSRARRILCHSLMSIHRQQWNPAATRVTR
ncbi:hypothetical protein Q7C36_012252 [Tachysurus vachellii]|uniref:Uncharacterized protein n=1 Tax=Tachysurus vachellii TaxID=175792 RepID=A0AA88MM35_TACVA|nr:hypothetical protein Q7C36_012252 [Tachysurus vachellii]